MTLEDCPNCGVNKINTSVSICSSCEISDRYEEKISLLEKRLAETSDEISWWQKKYKEDLAEIRLVGRREGEKDMQKRCGAICLKIAKSESYYSPNAADDCAEQISELEISKDKFTVAEMAAETIFDLIIAGIDEDAHWRTRFLDELTFSNIRELIQNIDEMDTIMNILRGKVIFCLKQIADHYEKNENLKCS